MMMKNFSEEVKLAVAVAIIVVVLLVLVGCNSGYPEDTDTVTECWNHAKLNLDRDQLKELDAKFATMSGDEFIAYYNEEYVK